MFYSDWFSASRPISSSYKRFNHASTTSKSDFLWFLFHIGLFEKDLYPPCWGYIDFTLNPPGFQVNFTMTLKKFSTYFHCSLWKSTFFFSNCCIPPWNFNDFYSILWNFFFISSAGVLHIFFWKSLLTGLTLFLNWNLILIEWWYIDKLGVTLTTKFYYH